MWWINICVEIAVVFGILFVYRMFVAVLIGGFWRSIVQSITIESIKTTCMFIQDSSPRSLSSILDFIHIIARSRKSSGSKCLHKVKKTTQLQMDGWENENSLQWSERRWRVGVTSCKALVLHSGYLGSPSAEASGTLGGTRKYKLLF